MHWNNLGKSLLVSFVLHRINRLMGKGLQIPINLPWWDDDLTDVINDCHTAMSTLVHSVKVNANNVNIRDCDHKKQELKLPVTRSEDFLWTATAIASSSLAKATVTVDVDFQEVDLERKSSSDNNDLQSEVTIRKSNRLKKLSTVKKQNFL
jgi:hypothetical protein